MATIFALRTIKKISRLTKRYAILLFISLFLNFARLLAQTESGNLEFTENKGQWDSRALLGADIGNGTLFFTSTGLRVVLHDPREYDAYTRGHVPGMVTTKTTTSAVNPATAAPPAAAPGMRAQGGRPALLRAHAYAVRFLNMNPAATMVPDKPLDSYSNYLIGNDSTKWARNCRIYQGVTYKDAYPGIDIRYYTSDEKLKYDIIVHPGADPSAVVMQYDGVEGLTARNNRLSVKTSVGEVKEMEPYSYQTGETSREEVGVRYRVGTDKSVRFDVKSYDKRKVLIIDPTLVFSTFSGSKASNWGFTATPGPDGTFFAGGIVFGEGFPVSTGAFQSKFNNGKYDVGIIKLSSNGRNRLYATYIGGNAEECPHSLFSDAQGNLAIIGRTYSGSTFPAQNVYGSKPDKVGCNIFVVKLNAAGNGILGSALVGGSGYDGANIADQVNGEGPGGESAVSLIRNYGDDSRSEVILDPAGNIYVASNSRSPDFPVKGGFQGTLAGKQDGVIFKLSPDCKNMLFASYLGGSADDACFVMKLNPLNGDIYVAGASASPNLPGDKTGVIQPANAGGISDGFISVISNDGRTIRRTTYLGTAGFDAIYGIDFDRKGFPYVMGSTTGAWPTANAAFINPGAKQFVCKFQQNLSAFVYSTTFGTASPNPNISPVAFLVDRCENVYISGWGGWLYSSSRDPYGLSGTIGMPVTPDAIKRTTDGRDFYFIVIQKNASALLYGTFFGQNDGAESISEHVDGGTSRYDQNGIIYQGICANCGAHSRTPFLTTPGSWSPRNGTGGQGCNLAAVKIAFNFAGVVADPKPLINGVVDSSGCVPLEVLFVDTIHNAKQYRWSFGDGSPDTITSSYRVLHTYQQIGDFLVRLIAIDSNTCNVADTAYVHIKVRTDKAILDFDIAKLPPCASLSYEFTNQSIAPAGKPFGPGTFFWDFGDGTRVPGTSPIRHTFAAPGSYPIKLILLDTNYCNYPDSLTINLRVSPIVKAQFDVPSGCAPYTAFFNNTSLGGLNFEWDFGDGSPVSTEPAPVHAYADTGTFTIKLVANDASSCNKTDTTFRTLQIHSKPVAAFSTQPTPPQTNIPITFVNESIAGTHYKYYFGDGDSAERITTDTVIHQYPESNTFQACLIAYNQYECSDTICHNVEPLVSPLLDVPNAFTPGRFGQNSVILVKGFGVTVMTWKIYNRWGQLVFQSGNPNYGWDGTYKGVPQPMDVYGYTLEAQFNDGTKTTRKGDITLIR